LYPAARHNAASAALYTVLSRLSPNSEVTATLHRNQSAFTLKFNSPANGIVFPHMFGAQTDGNWQIAGGRNDYECFCGKKPTEDLSRLLYTETGGNSFTYSFYGTGIDYLSDKNSDQGAYDIYIDGVLIERADAYAASRIRMTEVFSIRDLPLGEHELKAVNVVLNGNARRYMMLDAFRVFTDTGKSPQAAFSIDPEAAYKIYGDADFQIAAAGGSGGGTVTFSVPENNGVLTVTAAGMAKITGAGSVTVTAVKAGDSDFDPAWAALKITVSPKSVTVTADNKQKAAGAADPALTWTVSPALSASDVLTGSLTYTGTEPGAYDIVEGTPFSHPHYEITFIKGTMTIRATAVVYGDINGDSEVTITDARMILQRLVRKIDKFPAEN